MCVTVVQWSRSCLNVQINRVRPPVTLFLFLCTFFFLFGLFSFTLFFLLVLFSLFLLLTLLVMHLDFYYGKGISKALDLHTGQAYDQKKTISSQDMSLLWTADFFSMLVDIVTNNTQNTTNCTNLHLTPTSDPPAKVNLACLLYIVLNNQYYYPKIPSGFAPKK